VTSQCTVSERLVSFVRQVQKHGAPPPVLHETKRLIINQLKASVGALDAQPVKVLRDWALRTGAPLDGPRIIWFGDRVHPEQAVMVNAALFEVLDFHDTYIPCFMHAVSGVLPAAMAEAEIRHSNGAAFLNALAIGIEVELACATLLLPSAYYRGFIAGALTGAIGGATACGILKGLSDVQMRDALGLAMNCGLGQYQTAGSGGFAYLMGSAARNGFTAADLAAAGLDAPAAAFEGDKGMLSSYSDEPPEKIETVIAGLGREWRIMGQSYKTVPTETITHGPIECALAMLDRSRGRTVERMRFGVEAIVVKIADERRGRFGAPNSEYTAKFDLRHCVAAAWTRGQFTLDEMREAAYTDPAILALRDRIELFHDPRHKTFDGCSLVVDYADGSSDEINLPAFKGAPANPMSDGELAGLFAAYARPVLPAGRDDAILDAAWSLDRADDINPFISLLSTL
jgi:2-methylcitrate dehydratase PrpD